MADKDNTKKKDELADIKRVDVEPLTDADLDTVAGGGDFDTFSPTNNATTGCGSNAANACC
jgi:hypothetical protein